MSVREPDGWIVPTYNRPHVDNWGSYRSMHQRIAIEWPDFLGTLAKVRRREEARELLPHKAIDAIADMMARMLDEGRHGRDDWRKMSEGDHLSHAAGHLCLLDQGDDSEDHLMHAACRLLMALEQRIDATPPGPGLTTDHVKIDASVFDDDG